MNGILIYIILCVSLGIILCIGFVLKRYTKRRLDDIDAFQGIMKKKDYLKSVVVVKVKDEREQKI